MIFRVARLLVAPVRRGVQYGGGTVRRSGVRDSRVYDGMTCGRNNTGKMSCGTLPVADRGVDKGVLLSRISCLADNLARTSSARTVSHTGGKKILSFFLLRHGEFPHDKVHNLLMMTTLP